MKRVWIINEEGSGIISSWEQEWGLSRNERTGRWIIYERRSGTDEGRYSVNTRRGYSDSTEHLVRHGLRGMDLQPEYLLPFIADADEPALRELAEAIRRRET